MIGKTISSNGEVKVLEKIIKVQSHSLKEGISNVEIITNDDRYILFSDNGDFNLFIDGIFINSSGFEFSLIIQEEAPELIIEDNKLNHPEFRYYILNSKSSKIKSGFEYREDADENFNSLINIGENDIAILSKKMLIVNSIDPDDNLNWSISSSDYSIIEEALIYGISQGNFSEESKNNYIDKYKNEGKYLTVIKANLIYYFSHTEKEFKNAIMNSQFEKSLKVKETMDRISNELLNIIKKDI